MKYLLCAFILTSLLVYQSVLAAAGADFSERDRVSGPTKSEYIKLINDEDIYKRIYAIYNVGHKKIPAKDDLVRLSGHDNPWVRRAAIFSLGLNPDMTLLPLLEKALNDDDYGVRRAAVIALGNTKSEKAGPLLARALKDSDYGTRELAAIAIAMNGMKNYVPEMIALLQDDSIRVRRTSARALGALGDKRAVKPLQKLMVDIENKRIRPRDKSDIRKRLKKKGTYAYGFIHFPILIDRLAKDTGIDLRVNDEVVYGLYINAQSPENLDSVKMKFYHTPTADALKKITGSAGAYYYIESGTVNIAAKSYIYFDTNLDFEVAASLYILGDKSYEKTIKTYRNKPIYKERVKRLLK